VTFRSIAVQPVRTITAVDGTHGGAWARHGSPFRLFLARRGFYLARRTDWWSLDVSGIPSWTASRKHSDWQIGGAFLADSLERLPYEQRLVLAWSHGGQVVAYAARRVRIARVITVCTPPRGDMEPVWRAAAAHIGWWRAIHAQGGDWWVRLGQVCDGRWGWDGGRAHAELGAEVIELRGIGHGGLLHDERLFHLWDDEALLAPFEMSDADLNRGRVAPRGLR
jgi:hypothetical protein